MRVLAIWMGAAVLPLAALAQPVDFSMTCVPQEQRVQAQDKVKLIAEETAKRRTEARARLSASALEQEREARVTAMHDCADAAKKRGAAPGEACIQEIQAFRSAETNARSQASQLQAALQAIAQEENRQLLALRAQWPSC